MPPASDEWNDGTKSERKNEGNGRNNENGDELKPLAAVQKNCEDELRHSNSGSFLRLKALPPPSRRGRGGEPTLQSLPEN